MGDSELTMGQETPYKNYGVCVPPVIKVVGDEDSRHPRRVSVSEQK